MCIQRETATLLRIWNRAFVSLLHVSQYLMMQNQVLENDNFPFRAFLYRIWSDSQDKYQEG